MSTEPIEVGRVASGVEGLDPVTGGGLPHRRLTLVSGTAGSGKTLLAVQFLAAGILDHDEPGVFVTFEERPSEIARNFRSLGWDVERWERDGAWTFVDASPDLEPETVVSGDYDLSSLVLRVRHAVQRSGAARVAIDSTGALVDQFGNAQVARRALFQIGTELQRLGVTAVMTAERPDDYGAVTRFGFEEFVADNVVILRNALADEKRRRTVEVLKLRGGAHLKGEHLFTIRPGRGMIVVPQEVLSFGYASSHQRLGSGVPELDRMCGGGLLARSLVLVSGPTGVGKSLLASHFAAGGALDGQRGLLFSFEESRDQLARNAAAWGIDFDALEADGRMRVVAQAPEAASLEDHLLHLKQVMAEFAPDRIAIDSLTALRRVATVKSFREYLLGLSFHIKEQSLLGLMTATSREPSGLDLSGDLHMSTVSDAIIVMQYVADHGRVGRAINVMKVRGSDHDKDIREFLIDDTGMHIAGRLDLRNWHVLPEVS
ncbi:circadian clock protein KaiC [Baekduia soli]|uniref:non-specific serine/threonine protein kinase n=1 Tax=Baekduia soli TaxID=496014 RepID=A0A5B8U9L0_9ACTN|nr:circadian clock protein KaiC [Baekduia soli]QEC49846.1 circadian clock protein KaiC [Baekduia soli]